MARQGGVVILGIFVADTAYRAERQPRMGETLLGAGFALGPGGKGSNQAVAAARAGAEVTFLSRIGQDPFGDMAMATWEEAGVRAAVTRGADTYTGAAYIFIDDATGDNAIIVCPGAATTITEADMDAAPASGPPGAGDRAGGRCSDHPQPGAGGPGGRRHLGAVRLCDPERDRGGGPDRRGCRLG
jgi:ribokinase